MAKERTSEGRDGLANMNNADVSTQNARQSSAQVGKIRCLAQSSSEYERGWRESTLHSQGDATDNSPELYFCIGFSVTFEALAHPTTILTLLKR